MQDQFCEKVLVWGAGGHAKVVADILNLNGFVVAGFLDDTNPSRNGESFCGSSVIGDTNELPKLYAAGIRKAIIAFGDNGRRVAAGQLLERRGFQVITAVHPTAIVTSDVLISPGSVVAAGAIVNSMAVIGRYVILNTGATVDHDCTVADGVHIGPGVNIAGHVKIGPRAWIGIGATIIDRKRIGEDAIVGAGSVVIDDVPASVMVVGVPAKMIKNLNSMSHA